MIESPDDPPIRRATGPRARLARAVRTAALSVPGVVDTDSGPSGIYCTETGGERFEGIICAANGDGGYEVSVRLITELVPLGELSERVVVAIEQAASVVSVRCSRIDVRFCDVLGSGDA